MTREPIATFLLPLERSRVDAAGEGCYTAFHRESFDELLGDLRAQRVSAVVLSVSRYQSQHAPHLARLVREFPRVPAVALLMANEPQTTHAVLALGQQGVRSLVKVCAKPLWLTQPRACNVLLTARSGVGTRKSLTDCVEDS